MIGQALQFGGSLAAILLLAWLARRLGLGSDPRLPDAREARRLAGEVIEGFDAREVVLDREGTGALLRDPAGRVMVLRRHGARWAGRLIDSQAAVMIEGTLVIITPRDKPFGAVTLDLGDDAQVWADSLQRPR